MASPHRKLFLDASNTNYTNTPTTSVQTCLYFCHSQKNESIGFCPTACLALCPSICQYSLSALISPPDPQPQPNKPQPHPNLSPLLVSMLILLASAFLLVTFYILYTKLFYHPSSQTRPYRGSPDHPLDHDHAPTVVFHPAWLISTVGLTPAVIDAIAVIRYTKAEKSSSKVDCTDCAVCLAEFEEGEELRVLPKCNHAFHIPCIDTWLKSHTNCPLCRAPVVAPDRDQMVQRSGAAAGVHTAGEERIDVGEREENMRSASANSVEDKESSGGDNNNNNKVIGSSSSSSSQRWGLERGAANLVSRSFSCGAKIFSSRYSNNNNNNNNSNS